MEYINEQHFEDIDFAKENIGQAEYSFCTFTKCNFADTALSNIRFIDSIFEDCNWSNANIQDCSIQDCKFENCKMLGLQFNTCSDFGFGIHCKNCNLQHSVFFKMDLRQCSFDHCHLGYVDFGEADLTSIKLYDCNLANTFFGYTNLERTNLTGSVNFNIDPDNNKLKGARFSATEVIRLLDKYGLVIE